MHRDKKHTVDEMVMRKKASKNTKPIATMERKDTMNAIIKRLLLEEISQGQALKELRISLLGMKQDDYARLVSVSRKTISDIENDKGNYTYDVINKVFKPFGLKAGLRPVTFNMFKTFLS